MQIKRFARWVTVCTALAVPFVAVADDNKDTTKDTTKDTSTKTSDKMTKLTMNEMHVLAHVHHVNQMEIDAGKLAEKNGSTQAVKSYGQMLVKDHTQNDRDIMAFAKKHNEKIGADAMDKSSDEKDAMARLKNMKGADFDREFLRQMADDHDKELAKIDSSMADISNDDLSTMLKDMKPVLQKHADQARDLMKSNAQAKLDQP